MTSNRKTQTDYLFYSKRRAEGKLKAAGIVILGLGILGSVTLLIMGDTLNALSVLTVPLVGALIAFMTVTVKVTPDKIVASFCGIFRTTMRIPDIAFAKSNDSNEHGGLFKMQYGYSILGRGSYGYNVGDPFVMVFRRNGNLGFIKASVDNPEKCVAVITDLVDGYIEDVKAGRAS